MSKITLLAPAHNEEKNLKTFILRSKKALKKVSPNFEIIIIDDGSTDNSFKLLKKLKKTNSQLKVIRLRRQSGQTAGIMAGISHSTGDIIVILDADLQQDPADIKSLVDPIKKGQADVVTGWRQKRKHSPIVRFIALVEKILNRLFLKVKLNDTAVSPNAYKTKTIKDLSLYGEMHRFMVPILYWRGYKILEVPVSHHPRVAGRTKYTTSKAIRGFLDLILVKFWQDYSLRPIQFFGQLGLLFMAIGTIIGLEEAIRKLVFHLSIYNRTLPLLAAFMFIVGVQFLIFGILADIMTRTYYQDKQNTQIQEVI